MLEEYVGGQAQVRDVWSPVYVDALVLRQRDTDANGTLEERLWAVQDANFNVTALIDDSGNVVERYVYDAFGARTVLSPGWLTLINSAYAWDRGYQGLRHDGLVGTVDNRGRIFLPKTSRHAQPDPLGFGAGDVNLYRDRSNSPINLIDPSGLYPPLLIGQVGRQEFERPIWMQQAMGNSWHYSWSMPSLNGTAILGLQSRPPLHLPLLPEWLQKPAPLASMVTDVIQSSSILYAFEGHPLSGTPISPNDYLGILAVSTLRPGDRPLFHLQYLYSDRPLSFPGTTPWLQIDGTLGTKPQHNCLNLALTHNDVFTSNIGWAESGGVYGFTNINLSNLIGGELGHLFYGFSDNYHFGGLHDQLSLGEELGVPLLGTFGYYAGIGLNTSGDSSAMIGLVWQPQISLPFIGRPIVSGGYGGFPSTAFWAAVKPSMNYGLLPGEPLDYESTHWWFNLEFGPR